MGTIRDVIRTLDETVDQLIRYRRQLANGDESAWVTEQLKDLWTHVTGLRADLIQTVRGGDEAQLGSYYTLLRIYGGGWLRSREEADEVRKAVFHC